MTNKSPEHIAHDWYDLDSVHNAIRESGNDDFRSWPKVPFDVRSREFAVWMTDHLRRAMAKGIQLGRGEPKAFT